MKTIFSLLPMLMFLSACASFDSSEIGIRHTVDARVSSWLAETGIPSVSIVVIQNGDVAWAEAYGSQNLARQLPANTATIYNPGSNVKSVTALAIMQLAEKGLIDIDVSINQYLPKPIKYYNDEYPVTARHLMSHQSGFPSSVNKTPIWKRVEQRTLLEISEQMRANSVPETSYQYCNDCFSVLGLVIEHLSGQSYESYVWQNILKPLGVTTYGFLEPSPEMLEHIALPYHMRHNTAFPTSLLHLEQYPAGDFFLTPMDMAKYLLLHINRGTYEGEQLLSAQGMADMHRRHAAMGGGSFYGLGFQVVKDDEQHVLAHSGSLPGYLSSFKVDLLSKDGVYVATNVSAGDLQVEQVNVLLDFLFRYAANDHSDEKLAIPSHPVTAVPFDVKSEDYIGRYKISGAEAYFTIEAIGKQLFVVSPAGKRFLMEPLSQYDFFLTTEDENIRFRFHDGRANVLVFLSGDQVVEAALVP